MEGLRGRINISQKNKEEIRLDHSKEDDLLYVQNNLFNLQSEDSNQRASNYLFEILNSTDIRLMYKFDKQYQKAFEAIYQRFEDKLNILQTSDKIYKYLFELHRLQSLAETFPGKLFLMRLCVITIRHFNRILQMDSYSYSERLSNFDNYVSVLTLMDMIIDNKKLKRPGSLFKDNFLNTLKKVDHNDYESIMYFINSELPRMKIENLEESNRWFELWKKKAKQNFLFRIYIPVNDKVLKFRIHNVEKDSKDFGDELTREGIKDPEYSMTITSIFAYDRKINSFIQRKLVKNDYIHDAISEEDTDYISPIKGLSNSPKYEMVDTDSGRKMVLPLSNGKNNTYYRYDEKYLSDGSQFEDTFIPKIDYNDPKTNPPEVVTEIPVETHDETLDVPQIEFPDPPDEEGVVTTPYQVIEEEDPVEKIMQYALEVYGMQLPKKGQVTTISNGDMELLINDRSFKFKLKGKEGLLELGVKSLVFSEEGKLKQIKVGDDSLIDIQEKNLGLNFIGADLVTITEDESSVEDSFFREIKGSLFQGAISLKGSGSFKMHETQDKSAPVWVITPEGSSIFKAVFAPPLSYPESSIDVKSITYWKDGRFSLELSETVSLANKLNNQVYTSNQFTFNKDGNLVELSEIITDSKLPESNLNQDPVVNDDEVPEELLDVEPMELENEQLDEVIETKIPSFEDQAMHENVKSHPDSVEFENLQRRFKKLLRLKKIGKKFTVKKMYANTIENLLRSNDPSLYQASDYQNLINNLETLVDIYIQVLEDLEELFKKDPINGRELNSTDNFLVNVRDIFTNFEILESDDEKLNKFNTKFAKLLSQINKTIKAF